MKSTYGSASSSGASRLRWWVLPVLLVATSVMVPNGWAQDYGQVEEINTNVDSYFFFSESGEGTIGVKVMGTVRNPGLYRLRVGTDLGQLLALSGGPVLSVRREDRDRETTIRLFRPQSDDEQELIFEEDFEGSITTRAASYPKLQNGDVMTVEVVEDRQFEWRDALTIVSASGSLAFAISQFVSN